MLRLLPRLRFPEPPPNNDATPSEVAGLEPVPADAGSARELLDAFAALPPKVLEPMLSRLCGSVDARIRPRTPGALSGASLATLLPLPERALPFSRSFAVTFDVDVVDDEPKKPFPTLSPRFLPVPGRVNLPPEPPSNRAPNSLISTPPPPAPGVDGVEVAAELDRDMLVLAAATFVDDEVVHGDPDPPPPPKRLPQPPENPNTLVLPFDEGESAVPGLREFVELAPVR